MRRNVAVSPFAFIGYNVYRSGKIANNEPLSSPGYLDITPLPQSGESVEYVVRAAYDRDESKATEAVTVSSSGVTEIISDIDPENTPVFTINEIRVKTLTEGQVYVTKNRRFICIRSEK